MVNNNKIVVLVVNESLTIGGAQSASVELANALSEQENVIIHFLAASGPLLERINNNIRIWDAPRFEIRKVIRLFWRYLLVIRKIKPDVVHTHSGTLLGIIWFAAVVSLQKVSFVFTHHSQMFTRLPRVASTILINRVCTRVIAVSKAKQQQLVRFGVRKTRVELIPNFVDVNNIAAKIRAVDINKINSSLGIHEGSFVLTTIGRLVPGKNHSLFISLVKQFARLTRDTIIGIIVGDGELRTKLEAEAADSSSGARFVFAGYTNDIYSYLAVTDLFLFPSEYEILPVVLLEAAASHVPVVCSDITGNNDIVLDGESGFLVSGGDREYLSAISQLHHNSDLRKKMGDAGFRIAGEKFDRSAIIKKYISLYKEISCGNFKKAA